MGHVASYRLHTALLLLSACSGPGPELVGRVEVDPCAPGPDAAGCALERDPNCAATYGNPAPEALASVSLAQAERVATTTHDGTFHFAGLAPGTYALSATVPNTVELRQAQVVELTGHSRTELTVRFVAAGTIEGRVLPPPKPTETDNTDGVGGIERVEVHLACPPRTAVTDAEGRFRFTHVPQGERHLSAVGLGLVGTAPPVQVYRGRITPVEIPLAYGRPPDAPGNRPPELTGPMEVTPLPAQSNERIHLRPPASTYVRGDRVALACAATDPDGDTLQYVWSASSGELQAGNAPTAVLTLGKTDTGVSCTVLDGRGGVAGTDALLAVADPYYAGATLISGGAAFAASYQQEFDLVLWTPGGATRVALAGPQWLPHGSGSSLAFLDRSTAVDSLWFTQVTASNINPLLVDTDPLGFAAYDGGVAWVDRSGAGHLRLPNGTTQGLGSGYDGSVASAGTHLAWGRTLGHVELMRVDANGATPTGVLPTLDRQPGALATDGTRVAYWAKGRPMVESPGGAQPLGPDEISPNRVGRVLLSDNRAAYSFYASPLQFVEATVVELVGEQVGEHLRAGIGPSEVLDLEGPHLLIGRPRAEEREPSGDLWIVDVTQLGAMP